jgi:F-type H+-transporting ATPase subunit gamma
MLDAYDAGEIQQLSVAYNKFENTMTQVPTVSQLVPMVAGEVTGMDYHWDYIYEPDAQEALGALLVRYIHYHLTAVVLLVLILFRSLLKHCKY